LLKGALACGFRGADTIQKAHPRGNQEHIENMQKAKGYICSMLNDTVKALEDEDDELLQCYLHFRQS